MAGVELLGGGLAIVDGVEAHLFVVCKVGAGTVDLIRSRERGVESFDRGRVSAVPLPRNGIACMVCGKWWIQRGNRSGHCAACHHTFEGLVLFDAHQRAQPDGSVLCLIPASMRWRGHRLRLVEGSWRGPALDRSVFGGESDGE